MKCGIDALEISRIEPHLNDKRFVEKVYGIEEIRELEKRGWPAQSAAAAFCAKEAFSKACGRGLYGLLPYEIQLLHETSGRPYIKLSGKAAEEFPDVCCDVSITHTQELAFAEVIIIERDRRND